MPDVGRGRCGRNTCKRRCARSLRQLTNTSAEPVACCNVHATVAISSTSSGSGCSVPGGRLADVGLLPAAQARVWWGSRRQRGLRPTLRSASRAGSSCAAAHGGGGSAGCGQQAVAHQAALRRAACQRPAQVDSDHAARPGEAAGHCTAVLFKRACVRCVRCRSTCLDGLWSEVAG